MWFHSLRCGSILGAFLCLVCLPSSSEASYAHLKPVRPLLFDAEMSTISQRKPRASGLCSAATPGTSNKSQANVFESLTTAESTAAPHILSPHTSSKPPETTEVSKLTALRLLKEMNRRGKTLLQAEKNPLHTKGPSVLWVSTRPHVCGNFSVFTGSLSAPGVAGHNRLLPSGVLVGRHGQHAYRELMHSRQRGLQ